MNWIRPANTNKYDVFSAFRDLNEIDWGQKNKYKIDDIVYIYCSKPIQKITHKCIVTKINISMDSMIDDSDYWTNTKSRKVSLDSDLYVRLKLLNEYTKELTLDDLGINHLQGPIKLTDKQRNFLNNYQLENINKCDINKKSNKDFTEGRTVEVKLNRYERNSAARQKCIEHYGCKCQICGMSFEERYGITGKGFIQVHHLMPLNKIKEEYKVDPINDLIPVCPNCHAMIHKLPNCEKLTIEEMKSKLLK